MCRAGRRLYFRGVQGSALRLLDEQSWSFALPRSSPEFFNELATQDTSCPVQNQANVQPESLDVTEH